MFCQWGADGSGLQRVAHPNVPLLRFSRSFSLQALKLFYICSFTLVFSLLSDFLFLCSSVLLPKLAGPLSTSLTVGGGGGGWREGRSAALTAGRDELSGEGGRK